MVRFLKKAQFLSTTLSCLAVLVSSTVIAPSPVYGNPQDGVVVGGSATITESDKKLDVHQHTDRAVIDWRSFNIAVDEHTQFHQPTSTSVMLNRVNDTNPSHIAGQLSANGNIILVNPNGVFFDRSSRVDVNGLIATTANIAVQDFMHGSTLFDITGNPTGAIVNEGTITAKEAGLVGLVAPYVENRGVIQARLGRVQLSSGDTVTVDFYGDDLLHLAVEDDAIKNQLVVNSGLLSADGGVVAMTAAAAQKTVDALIVADGVVSAQTIAEENGKIIIGGARRHVSHETIQEGNEGNTGSAFVAVTGILDASGRDAGEQGGQISVLGDHIAVGQNAIIDTSGHSAIDADAIPNGGGTATMTADKRVDNGVRTEVDFLAQKRRAGGSIKIGGDYLGQGDTQTAKTVKVAHGALFLNDAIDKGDAGRTIIWSDDTTEYRGLTLARGGVNGGHGGFLETSGKLNLLAKGAADLSNRVEGYNKGTYLLDPADITIYGNVDPTFSSTDGSIDLGANLNLWVDASDASTITLSYEGVTGGATASGTAGANTITTSADIAGDLAVGARIRLGDEGPATTADTLGDDTYTITAISGTTITLKQTLTKDYTGRDIRLGRVAVWRDKSGKNNNAEQYNNGQMALYLESQQNNHSVLRFDGNQFYELPDDTVPADNNNYTVLATLQGTQGGFLGSGNYGTPGEVNAFRYRGSGFRQYWWANDVDFFVTSIADPHLVSFTYDNTVGRSGFFNASLMGANNATGRSGGHGNNTIGITNGREYLYGPMFDMTIYDAALDDNSRQLVEQYQAEKWGIELSGPGTGSTEAEKAMAADGYGVFTTRYLEHLSESSDIVLKSSSSITLDLKNDTLALDSGRSLTLETNLLQDASAGTIQTDNGDINFTASSIDLDSTKLTATGNGDVRLTSTNGVNFAGQIHAETVNITAQGDIRLQDASIEATGTNTTAIVIDTSTVFHNEGSGGIDNPDALNVIDPSSRWLIYSNSPTIDRLGGLRADFKRYNTTSSSSVTLPTGNGTLYSIAPVIRYSVNDVTVEYGNALGSMGLTYQSGLLAGDTFSSITQTGLANITSSYGIGDNAGFYSDHLQASLGTLTNELGYQYQFVAGDLTVDKADLAVSLNPTHIKIAQGSAIPTMDLTFGPFKLADTQADLDVLPVINSIVMPDSPVGRYMASLQGGSDNNYNYAVTNGVIEIVAPASSTNFDNEEVKKMSAALQRELAEEVRRLNKAQQTPPQTLAAEEVLDTQIVSATTSVSQKLIDTAENGKFVAANTANLSVSANQQDAVITSNGFTALQEQVLVELALETEQAFDTTQATLQSVNTVNTKPSTSISNASIPSTSTAGILITGNSTTNFANTDSTNTGNVALTDMIALNVVEPASADTAMESFFLDRRFENTIDNDNTLRPTAVTDQRALPSSLGFVGFGFVGFGMASFAFVVMTTIVAIGFKRHT
ncbi:filamentous hemagglutinin N-terminal domain-containing protein [Marinomonas agarivorans]|nr:filamentous hemagglutinin N-terminal domain-containing protein [Marinomonas agarivorans]